MSHKRIETESNLVVCLHASASSARQWQSLADELAGNVEVLLPHLVGYGQAAPFDETAPYSFSTEIDAVVDQIGSRWLEDGTKIHLVGHSYGAATALHLAQRFPERIASLTLFEPILFRLLADDEGWSKECLEICLVGNYVRSKAYGSFSRTGAVSDLPGQCRKWRLSSKPSSHHRCSAETWKPWRCPCD